VLKAALFDALTFPMVDKAGYLAVAFQATSDAQTEFAVI
jgi:hypothetical protein